MTFSFYICTGEPSLVPRLLAAHREPGYEVKENHSAIILYEPLIFVALPVSQRIRSPRKSDPGQIRFASDFDPTIADSIRGINGAHCRLPE